MKLIAKTAMVMCLASLAPCASAQGQRGGGLTPPQDRPDAGGLLPRSPFRSLLERGEVPSIFDGTGPKTRRFQGFPTLAPPDFGSYPSGQLALPFGGAGAVLPPVVIVPRSENSWPRWLDDDSEGFVPTVAILGHSNDYAWVREAEADAYVPLAPYDRYRVVSSGTEVDVRGGGQFTVHLHGGAEVRVLGRAHVTLTELDETVASLTFEELNHVFVIARERPVHLHLGHELHVEATGARLVFERDLDGSIGCTNESRGECVVELRGERTPLLPGRRVRLLPAAPARDIPSELAFDGDVRLTHEGRVLRATSALRGGRVAWSGTRFRLDNGGVLRIDPLAGSDFPTSPSNSK